VTRGDRRRVFHFLLGLSRHAEVTLACFGAGPPLPGSAVRVVSVARRLPSAVRANLRQADPRTPLQVRLYLDARMRELVEEERKRFSPHVVHATLARMAPYLPRRGSCHRHLDLVDALSLNMHSRASASSGPARLGFMAEARLLRRFEARWAAAVDSCSLASNSDRAAPGLERASVIGNGVDPDAFPFRDPGEGRSASMLFFGNLGYFHNVEPARFAAEEVLPRVRRTLPGARLRIAGARPGRVIHGLQRLAGVSVVGPVEDMARELHRADIAVLPMFSGSGVKNKVLEAFCAGTPVVTTRAGIQGLGGAQADRHYLAGETASEMASACLRLLSDPPLRRALANEAFALVRREFSWDRKVDALLELYGA
jgi:glycosyltransferase involved in cell wall biosynthesis